MNQIIFNENRTLKLTNVLISKLDLEYEELEFNVTIEKIQSYIKTKGAMQIGPLIQYVSPNVNEQGEFIKRGQLYGFRRQ